MSNHQVGNVYQQIIEEVINASRGDFEEQGVEDNILLELRKGWQIKLSKLKIADFPWDPKPEPQPTPAPPAQQPQQQQQQPIAQQQAQSSQQTQQPSTQFTQTQQLLPQQTTQSQHGFALPSNPVANGTQVKREPGVSLPADPAQGEPRIKEEPGASHPPPQTHNVGNVPARLIENLKNKYGEAATATISQIQHINQAGGNFTQSQGPQVLQHRPGGPQQQQTPQQSQQYHHALQQQMQQQMRVQQQMRQHQNDGAAEPDNGREGILMRGAEELGRVEIDGLLHSQIAAAGRELEGGGLMVSLKPAAKGTMQARRAQLSVNGPASSSTRHPTVLAAYQGDASMEDDDDEAINSDLDDPEDDKDSDDEDEEGGNVMLCVYDKVQRVKNKWKCTLKDGVLTVNGREYVFHKAQGEFEW